MKKSLCFLKNRDRTLISLSPSLTDEQMGQIAMLNRHDGGTVNFNDPEFIRYLIGDIRVEIYGDFG